MITIIFAPPRTGKTCFMTYMLNEIAFDRSRFCRMRNEIVAKNNAGFELSLPPHCCSSNYPITFRKFGYSPRHSRHINPFRLGFKNKFVETHFNFPFEAIGITEAQKYLNSRMSKAYPDWQSRWYEQHGHNNLDIFLDTQRPGLIDVNIRELSSFIEIMELTLGYDGYGKVDRLKWRIRCIDSNAAYDRYIASGKKDGSCFEEKTVTAEYNVFSLYDSQSCKPKFYDGHFDEDFDYRQSKPVENSLDDYIKYLEETDDELPKNFYSTEKNKAA